MRNIFKNPRTLASAINDIADIELTARPYNRFEPDKTPWWLIPTTNWPAYKYGKIFFSMFEETSEKTDSLFCGFNIEKGFAWKLNEFYHRSLIMDEDWLWNEFIHSRDERLYSILSKLVTSSLFLVIATSYIPSEKASYLDSPEGFLAQKENFKSDEVVFNINNKMELNIRNKKFNPYHPEIADYFESEIIDEKQLPQLALKLTKIPKVDWLWIDFSVGIVIDSKKNNLSPAEIWKNYLEPWKPWLR